MRHLTVLTLLFISLLTSFSGAQQFGLISIPVAPLREQPGHEAEMGTQAMLGTPVALEELVDDSWWLLQLPDGYRGYIHASSIKTLTDDEALRWRDSRRVVFTDAITPLVSALGQPAGYAPYGTVLEVVEIKDNKNIVCKLPGGEVVTAQGDFANLDDVAARRPDSGSIERVIQKGMLMQGAPYLWGGTTMLAPDCSGFTQLCWREAGVLLPRNASQQALAGTEVPGLEQAKRGDLLFFASPSGRIDHVALYLGVNQLIQSSAQVWHGAMQPDDASGLPYYGRKVAAIRRIAGGENVPLLSDNSLYFNK